MLKTSKEILLDLASTPFNLDFTLTCGQAFRWERRGDWWRGVVKDTFVRIRQTGGLVHFQAYPEMEADFVWSYFRLDDDLPSIYLKIAEDAYVREAIEKFRGLRLMRQDPWECLISYICATNKNIPAIKNMIENMCTRFGKKIMIEGQRVYTFPQPQDLAQASLRDLRLCKLGFRAERVKKTSKLIEEGNLYLETLRKKPYEEAKKELMTLPGVGPKVADCVLLFSLEKLQAFPIDVWMKRLIIDFYKEHFRKSFVEKLTGKGSLSPHEYEILSSFGREYFGKYVGYAQEYLFHFKRCSPRT